MHSSIARFIKYNTAFVVAIIIMSGCGKTSVTPKPQIITPKADTDVYAVGDIVAKNGKQIAVYWKNGVLVKLTDSSQTSFGETIAVSGNDVYVSGVIDDDNYYSTAVYWKNGIVNMLSKTPLDGSVTRSIALSGSDVYIAGLISGTNGGLYWKNGIPVTASGDLSYINPFAIALSGSDVYVAGTSLLSDGRTLVATYWKNGVKATIANSYSYAFGIAVSGNDVYVAGNNTNLTGNIPSTAAYWKNGNPVSLSSQFSQALGVAVNGSDVYFVGFNTLSDGLTGVACYWKNGVANNMVSGSLNSYAPAIALNGSDVYIAGRQDISNSNASSRPLYWKNGKPVLLPYNGSGEAVGIAVVVH